MTTDSPYVLIYIERTDGVGEPVSFVRKVGTHGSFDISLTFPDVSGEYYFVVSQGTSFQTEKPPIIHLISKDVLTYPSIPSLFLKKQNPFIAPSESGVFFTL